MKKSIFAILLSLLIPAALISCSKTSDVVNNEESKINNSSSVNNTTISENNNSTTSETDSKTNIEEDNKKEEVAKIYYYDVVSDKIIYITTTITIDGDDAITSLISELKKSPNDQISPSLSNEITLNSSNLDIEKSTINLDFSSNFVSAQNLGSGAESRTLTAICNTFGDYFKVDNVVITLDGKPYSSGHILMNAGESFKVNLDNTVELK